MNRSRQHLLLSSMLCCAALSAAPRGGSAQPPTAIEGVGHTVIRESTQAHIDRYKRPPQIRSSHMFQVFLDETLVPQRMDDPLLGPLTAGGFQFEPYGAFWASMVYATARTATGPFTLFVFSRDDQGEPSFTTDARRSRFGFKVIGPEIPLFAGASNGGRLEIDFFGDFVTVENRAAVLLRHAYWEVGDASYRFLIGQTWDVVAPLDPGTVNHAVGLNAGNIGFRRAQIRAERFVDLSNALILTLQGSLNQDIVPDFQSEPGIRREVASWPVLEGRIALTHSPDGSEECASSVGVSGHIGETGFDFLTAGPGPLNLPPQDDARFRTWSLNVDFEVPLTERLEVRGEFFTGENLSAYFGGIGQGVCPCLRVPIRSTGGWLEFVYDWSDYHQSHVGFGIDDPKNEDSLFGRVYNQFIFANVIVNLTENLSTGLEVTFWKTLYKESRVGQIPADELTPSARGEATTIEWMVRYSF